MEGGRIPVQKKIYTNEIRQILKDVYLCNYVFEKCLTLAVANTITCSIYRGHPFSPDDHPLTHPQPGEFIRGLLTRGNSPSLRTKKLADEEGKTRFSFPLSSPSPPGANPENNFSFVGTIATPELISFLEERGAKKSKIFFVNLNGFRGGVGVRGCNIEK